MLFNTDPEEEERAWSEESEMSDNESTHATGILASATQPKKKEMYSTRSTGLIPAFLGGTGRRNQEREEAKKKKEEEKKQ